MCKSIKSRKYDPWLYSLQLSHVRSQSLEEPQDLRPFPIYWLADEAAAPAHNNGARSLWMDLIVVVRRPLSGGSIGALTAKVGPDTRP
jgi:hypothetical protein